MLTVLMGAPAAGKSTWVKHSRKYEIVISSEAVRVYRDEIDVAEYMDAMRLVGLKAIKAGKSIIVDATNTFPHHRKYWLKVAIAHNCPKRLIAFDTPLIDLLNGQRIRQHPAPDYIVKAHFKRFNEQIKNVSNEGWDSVQIIKRGS